MSLKDRSGVSPLVAPQTGGAKLRFWACWPFGIMRYLLREFLRSFALFMGALVIVVTLFNVLDEMNRVFRYNPPVWAAITFLVCKVPKTVVEVTPLAVLLGTLFTLTSMLKSYELIAMRASGVSQYAIAAPFLIPAIAISLLSIGFSETVMPWANQKRAEIKQVHLLKRDPLMFNIAAHVALWTSWRSGPRLVYVVFASAKTGLLHGVTIVEFKGLKPVARIDAATVRPIKGAWELTDAQVYRWHKNGIKLHLHRKAVYPVQAELKDFLVRDKPVDAQTMSDLTKSIERMKKSGREYAREQVFYYLKWAHPFASFIVALLGLGISFNFQSNPREGQAAAIVVAIATSFGYIGLAQLGQTLGVGGVLPPLVAMWMANAVFLTVGIALLWKAWKY